MRVTWEVEDGYVGKSRPQYTEINDSEILECETREERLQFIADAVQEDFDNGIMWGYSSDVDALLDEVEAYGGIAMNMKYDNKVLKAIGGSIDKWIGIAYEGGRENGEDDCALCQLFKNGGGGCRACPIGKIGNICNVDIPNPYGEWDDATPEIGDEQYKVNSNEESIQKSIAMLDYLLHLKEWYILTADRG